MGFKSLVNVISEQRQEIKQALTLFPYFETWEPELIAECCRVSSVVEFPPDEIILGPDTGNSHAVYFILEGVCKMLKNLSVVVKRGSHSQKLFYKLHNISPSKTSNPESKNESCVSRLINQNHYFKKEIKPKNGTENPKEFEKEEKIVDDNQDETSPFKAEAHDNEDAEGKCQKCQKSMISDREDNSKMEKLEVEDKNETVYVTDHHLTVLGECKKKREDMIRVVKKVIPPKKPENTKCFFMQIGFLLRGACFGLEKNADENFMISATAVKCLSIPRGFLLQHSPCNIWNRIRLFHSLHLPDDEKIFEYFKSERKWMERKKALTGDIISRKNIPHYNSLSEVPYSIRLAHPQ